MPGRQSFNDFLNSSPGPSTYRGRGRGRGRGGGYGDSPGGGGRGGRGAFGGGGGGQGRKLGGYNADYKSVGFDYSQIANQKYVNMASYNVNPYGAGENKQPSQSSSQAGPAPPFTPRGRGRGDYTPRGGGRKAGIGRGGLRADSPSAFSAYGAERGTPSGSRTPVTGLGFKGKGKAREDPIRSSPAPGRTLRSGEVVWGGGPAPLFIKAGELFKDGEVDDPSLHRGIGIDLDVTAFRPEDEADDIDSDDGSARPSQAISLQALSIADAPEPLQEPSTVEAEVVDTVMTEEIIIAATSTRSPLSNHRAASPPMPLDEDSAPTAPEPARTVPALETVSDELLFFVDTAPASTDAPQPETMYEKVSEVAIGSNAPRSDSEEEQIVYAPRTYRQPEAISLPTPAAAKSAESAAPACESIRQMGSDLPSRVFIDPRARMTSRKAKKAAKKEKRRNRGKKGRKSGGGNDMIFSEDSDLEWGSDGPPPEISAVYTGVDTDAHECDVDVLKDYLAGTLLGRAADQEEEDEEEIDNGMDEEDDELDLEAMRRFGLGARRLAAGEIGDVEMSDGSSDESGDSDEADRPAGRRKTAQRQGGEGDAQTDDDAGSIRDRDDDDDVELDSDASDSDSGESSSLGAIQAVMGDLDDFDTEDEEALLFTGQDGWAKETDWFIQNMEDALDGGAMSRDRTSRNKLFKSIENGRFGTRGVMEDDIGDYSDDWNLEPVKKNKKNKHIPAALQAQWEKDRQKKALKREQRELERLIAQLNPSLASMGKGGKKGKAAKGKGKGKAQMAAMAHLIPASAAEVADMFDITTDEDDEGPSLAAARMGKMRGLLLPKTLPQVEIEIRQFLLDDGRTTHSLPPMDKDARTKVHMLAEAFDLKSKSKGKGSDRFTILIKTSRSGRNNDERKIARLVAASAYSGGQFYKAMYAKGGKSAGGKSGGGGKGAGDRGSSTRAREGDLVGEGAAQIGQENIGHKLLSKMGWAAGDRIGRTGGLEAPIVAVVKYTKRGLGV